MKPLAVIPLIGLAACFENGFAPESAVGKHQPPAPPPVYTMGTQLRFSVQPEESRIYKYVTPAVKVAVLDLNGELVTHQIGGLIDTIIITIETNPGGATLSGRTTAVTTFGVATFPNLRLDARGVGYRLRGSSSRLESATSAPFAIR